MTTTVAGVASIDVAKLLGKSDALEVAFQIGQLTTNMTGITDYSSVQQEIQNIMNNTISILSPKYAKFFELAPHRLAYYESLENQMRLTGLVPPEDVEQVHQRRNMLSRLASQNRKVKSR